jgi:hypothetical protein
MDNLVSALTRAVPESFSRAKKKATSCHETAFLIQQAGSGIVLDCFHLGNISTPCTKKPQ